MYALETNGPVVAHRMRAAGHVTGYFTVVACHYDGSDRTWTHRTLKAAFRRLGSVVSSGRGKLHRRDVFAAAIVTPAGSVMNWCEARTELGLDFA
jgi:hypothetical protein